MGKKAYSLECTEHPYWIFTVHSWSDQMLQLSVACRSWSKLAGLRAVPILEGLQLSVIHCLLGGAAMQAHSCVPSPPRLDLWQLNACSHCPELYADTMLTQYVRGAGRCPCSPLLLPRRITDGSLANAWNLKHAMESPSSSTLPSPPGSAASRSRPGSGRLDSRDSIRMLDRQATLSGKLRPPSAGTSPLQASARQSGSPLPEEGLQLPPIASARSTDIFASLTSLVAKSPPRPGSPLQRNMSRGSHLAGPTTSTLPPIPDSSSG